MIFSFAKCISGLYCIHICSIKYELDTCSKIQFSNWFKLARNPLQTVVLSSHDYFSWEINTRLHSENFFFFMRNWTNLYFPWWSTANVGYFTFRVGQITNLCKFITSSLRFWIYYVQSCVQASGFIIRIFTYPSRGSGAFMKIFRESRRASCKYHWVVERRI